MKKKPEVTIEMVNMKNTWVKATLGGKRVKGWLCLNEKPPVFDFPLADGSDLYISMKDVLTSLKVNKVI